MNGKNNFEIFGTDAQGINSIALGYATETKNYGEVAVGILNDSIKGVDTNTPEGVIKDKQGTLFSVGCGDHKGRKNAIEVKGDGTVNILGIGNLQEKLKQFGTTLNEITLKKNADNDLQYTLYVGGKDCGQIDIPKDQFLKSVEYNEEKGSLVFVFETAIGENNIEVNLVDSFPLISNNDIDNLNW